MWFSHKRTDLQSIHWSQKIITKCLDLKMPYTRNLLCKEIVLEKISSKKGSFLWNILSETIYLLVPIFFNFSNYCYWSDLFIKILCLTERKLNYSFFMSITAVYIYISVQRHKNQILVYRTLPLVISVHITFKFVVIN